VNQTITATTPAPAAGPVAPADGAGSIELAALADRHGLSVSGARPSPVEYLRRLWARRQFITTFATARSTSQYSQARLGQIWQVMTPLLNAAVYYFVFGLLLGTKRGVPDFIPFLVTGVFIWTFTAQTVGAAAKAISGNLGLVRALHFPRACLPLALTIQQLQQLLFSLGALVVLLAAFGQYPRVSWLLALPALLLQSVFNAGLALVVARLGSRTPDVAQLVPFIVRVWMYVSGVMWSIDQIAGSDRVPHAVYVLLRINPPAVYIDLMRFALIDSFGAGQLPPHVWLVAAGWAALAGLSGFLFFWQAEEKYGRG
jgi:teichoic acid transport system permease protein